MLVYLSAYYKSKKGVFTKMEKQKVRIMRFSRVIFILLKIAFIALIVVGVMEALAWFWTVLKLHTEVVSIGGVNMEMPLLFKVGNLTVTLPIAWEAGFDYLGTRAVQSIGFDDLLQTILTLVGISFAKQVFMLLMKDGSPFREEVVRSLKRLAIALIVVGVVSGVIPFLAAGIAWVLCLIFDYGRALQNESDTIL